MSDHQTKDQDQTEFKEENAQPTESQEIEGDEDEKRSDTGLDQNTAALLTYVAGFVTGIVFLFIEKKNRFVRFHALQSIITSAIIFIASLVLTAIPIIGWIIGLLLSPLSVVLWVLLLVKAYQGKWFKLPIAGDMAEQQLDKIQKND